MAADTPQERLKSIDLLISSNPKIVVYGIAYRAFMDQTRLVESVSPISPLPNPQDFFNVISAKIFSGYDLEFIDNPKLVTLNILKSLKNYGSKSVEGKTIGDNLLLRPYPNALFNVSLKDIPKNDVDLRNLFFVEGVTFNKISDYDKNPNVIAFKEIITKLEQNNIEIIIFITPQSKYYLDAMPNSAKITFETMIQNIEKDHKLKIHSLLDKYKDMNIWYNAQHIAIFNNTHIYSTDISKIINEEHT